MPDHDSQSRPTVCEIRMRDGSIVLVDQVDYELVAPYRWYAVRDHGNVYTYTHIQRDGRDTTRKMHRMIMDVHDPVFSLTTKTAMA